MKLRVAHVIVGFLSLVLPLTQLTVAQTSAQTASALPRLVRFGGTAKDLNGNPLTGFVGITFALYSEQTGGSPLWLETQNVTADNNGHYVVLLGSTKPEGLPAELFTSEQARWVGVQVSGQEEQPRVLLVSAPYALKAGDAETIGGLPPSAFVLAVPAIIGSAAAGSPAASTAESVSPATMSDVTTTGGTVNTIPLFSTATNIQTSNLTQTGTTAVNVAGKLNLPATAAATKTAGADSRPLDFVASSFSSTSSAAVNQTFQWQAEPAANDTATPSGTLNLLYALGTAAPTETGLKLNNKGVFTFATGQTFPGTGTGDGSVTSVATGLGLKGGPITKTGTLTIDTTVVPQLAVVNTFKVSQTIDGSLGINTAAPSQSLDVTSGNAIVRGVGNFKAKGDTATLWIGDANHPIKAIWNTGLEIGTFKAPTALFISDTTGKVGIGTTAPVNALDVVGNVSGETFIGAGLMAPSGGTGGLGLSATGGPGTSATQTSGAGGAGIYATGGTGATTATSGGNGGVGVYAYGGQATQGNGKGGVGLIAEGAIGYYNDGGGFAGSCCGGDGVDTYGSGEAFGLQAFGGGAVYEFENGYTGIMSTGGPGENQDGQGIVAQGGSGSDISAGGDGIDAFGGVPPASSGNPSGLAGSFTGDVSVTGNLTVSGTKSFKIDHPLDPANRYLYHASVESSEVLNLYSGNVVLDGAGEAQVQLPQWLESVNKDFRYQLTAIGGAAPNLHIAEEIQNHSFRIAGGTAGMKVSWQVTGVRDDAWEKAHPMVVELQKPAVERGYYLSPELFGAPPQKGIQWARNPKLMQRMKEAQQQARARRAQVAQNAAARRP
jgi:hypothetical protein